MTAGLTPDEVRRVLEETGVIRRGHFLLTSGLHTDLFLLCALVQQHPAPTARLAAAMAAPYRDARVQVVAGTAMGGVILAYEVARVLGARAIYAEKARDGGMVLRRGFRVAPGERALVVEDAVTTGGSIRKVLRAVEAAGGHVVGVSALVDRSAGRTDVGVPLRALLTLDVPAWEPATCPLCRQGVRLVEPKELTG
ncbi:MAG: orotate phosphoribosyltransferase [Armatimonadota bacterium]|nr:orotate phosphoribosyltransferase [Armatimonadota bacterium]MDR7454303.1 orotate phosphoribosyltransferase [Armatimonadota bacterium]MDR7456098.1 orotate phosphoribosyltransferase [Armatimonadota bacterium]MDR7495340.1 orotate phosphoribosyltransferase [Armatimonadota bacterium]